MYTVLCMSDPKRIDAIRQLLVGQGKPQLDPYKVMCVCKHNGREVGKVAAAASNAEAYITELVRHYGDIEVEYVEDATAAMVSQMLRPR